MSKKPGLKTLSTTVPRLKLPANETQSRKFFNFLDKLFQAQLAKLTAGISPAAMASAYCSWLAQLSIAPGRLLELACYPLLHNHDALHNIISASENIEDIRFHSDNWQLPPWRFGAEFFLQMENWWRRATVDIPGMPPFAERTISFSVRQILDALSPSNFVLTNPDLFAETIRCGGQNLLRGAELGIQDWLEKISGAPVAGAEHFIPGKDVAVTKGKIVYSNHLIELIQYEPQTSTVFKEPILILPAWIMKYYILDLSPHNSLVRWLVSQGHTVFIVSWRNPERTDRDLSMDDYFRQGAMSAIDAIQQRIPKTKIHLMGYCLGGTLAIIVASFMAARGDRRLKSLSLLAAQGDFTQAGELMLFITESEIAFLENMMWEQGYLDTKQMAGSFQMLRSYDLIWSKMVQDYMHGTQRGLIDLLAWNADATRMPYKMHSEYLEKLFLNNDLANGHYCIEGQSIVAENIHLPAFVVSTEKDHVAPWKSVYKIHIMVNSNVTFVLASGGHNAGIVSEPGHPNRSYHIHTQKKHSPYIGPSKWLEVAEVQEGSWWLAWHTWLVERSTETRVQPRYLEPSLPCAPGSYVLQK